MNDNNEQPIAPFIAKLEAKIRKESSGKYSVSPREAYVAHKHPRGKLKRANGKCISCAGPACYYSAAGLSELSMTSMCEPCFDFNMTPVSDREELDQWMKLVEYNKKDD